jgi:hypothetical protein
MGIDVKRVSSFRFQVNVLMGLCGDVQIKII